MEQKNKWKQPHPLKIYEALGAIAHNRVKDNTVYSSSGNKYYTVEYDGSNITTNDNAAYYKGTFGYSAIAYLMSIGELPIKQEYLDVLEGIPWKDINQEYKNDYTKVQEIIDQRLIQKGVDIHEFRTYVKEILESIRVYGKLGAHTQPPKGY